MKKVYIQSNGCAVLIHETERIAKYFTLNGWYLVEHPEEAKILIMTCCGVTQNEEDEAIGIITEIESRRATESHFVISGCMPSFARERVLETSPQATVLKYDELSMLDGMISASIPFHTVYYNSHPLLKCGMEDTFKDDDDLSLMRKFDNRHNTNLCEQAWEFSTM